MKNFILPLVLVAVAIIGYAVYKRNKNSETTKKSILSPEDIDELDMPDIVAYFKSLNLDKNKHKPFVMQGNKLIRESFDIIPYVSDGKIIILLGVFDEKNDKVDLKLLACTTISDKVKEILGDDELVCLS